MHSMTQMAVQGNSVSENVFIFFVLHKKRESFSDEGSYHFPCFKTIFARNKKNKYSSLHKTLTSIFYLHLPEKKIKEKIILFLAEI